MTFARFLRTLIGCEERAARTARTARIIARWFSEGCEAQSYKRSYNTHKACYYCASEIARKVHRIGYQGSCCQLETKNRTRGRADVLFAFREPETYSTRVLCIGDGLERIQHFLMVGGKHFDYSVYQSK